MAPVVCDEAPGLRPPAQRRSGVLLAAKGHQRVAEEVEAPWHSQEHQEEQKLSPAHCSIQGELKHPRGGGGGGGTTQSFPSS